MTTGQPAASGLPRRLGLALAVMRLSLGGFLLVWGLEKFVNPSSAMWIFENLYFVPVGPAAVYVAGVLQCAIALAVLVGLWRTWSYGLALLLHAATTITSIEYIIDPWGLISGDSQHLFLAAVPLLAGYFALYWLRAWDIHTVDGRRST